MREMGQPVYGRSKFCFGVEEHHPPPPPSPPPSSAPALIGKPPLPPQLSLQKIALTCVCVFLCVCMFDGSNGSGTSEDLFWKLDALQTFIRDLHWPEEEFARHLESRIKLMSSNMIENCVKRCVCLCVWGRKKPPGSKCWEWMLCPMFYATLWINISLALQHSDGIWVQAGKEQQVDRFPHFPGIVHHVQRDGGCQGPVC